MAVALKQETPKQRRDRQRYERNAARAEETFSQSRNAHRSYSKQLQQVASQVARIIQHYHPEGGEAPVPPGAMARIEQAVAKYSSAIIPWARASAARMIAEVNRKNLTAWQRHTTGMATELRNQIAEAPIGEAANDLLEQQVDLITSLPWDAARRVQEASLEAITTGERYPERTGEIEEQLAQIYPQSTEEWLKNRATLIARTETARAASVLTQARAQHVGAESYIWKTAGDWKVRESHRKLNGTVHRWDENDGQGPLSDPPYHYSHPGQIWNCRCTAIPIVPEAE